MIRTGLTMTRTSEIRKIAFVGDYLPRKCGIATFTHDMYASVAGRFPDAECCVVPVNDRIRLLVASEGVFLVDLYQAFGGVADTTLISSDGLHPSAAGNQRIAETFFTAIQARLESAGIRSFEPRASNRSCSIVTPPRSR